MQFHLHRYRLRKINRSLIFLCLFLLIIFGLLGSRLVVFVNPGETGVKYSLLGEGTVLNKIYGEGIHLKWPWDLMFLYSRRIQKVDASSYILSSNGLEIFVSFSYHYRPQIRELGFLHKYYGHDYAKKLVHPHMLASVRDVVGKYSAEELYHLKRKVIQQQILVGLKKVLKGHYVIVEDILIKHLKLPETLRKAIATKLTFQQKYLAYEYRLKKARKEAARLAIEAKGIHRYHSIIKQSLDNRLLEWEGINATNTFSESKNNKYVLVGPKGLDSSIILNMDKK